MECECQSWAADEDGIRPDCWQAFKNAACFIGELDRLK